MGIAKQRELRKLRKADLPKKGGRFPAPLALAQNRIKREKSARTERETPVLFLSTKEQDLGSFSKSSFLDNLIST